MNLEEAADRLWRMNKRIWTTDRATGRFGRESQHSTWTERSDAA
jgi:hypothetical protein